MDPRPELLSLNPEDQKEVADLRELDQQETGAARVRRLTRDQFFAGEVRRMLLARQPGWRQTIVCRSRHGGPIVAYLDYLVILDPKLGVRVLCAYGFVHPAHRRRGHMRRALACAVRQTGVSRIRTSVVPTPETRGVLAASGLRPLPYTRLEREYGPREWNCLDRWLGTMDGTTLRLRAPGYAIEEARVADAPEVSRLLLDFWRNLRPQANIEPIEHGVHQLVSSAEHRLRHGILFVFLDCGGVAGTFRVILFYNLAYGGWELMVRDIVLVDSYRGKGWLPWLVHGGAYLARQFIDPSHLPPHETVLVSTYVQSEPNLVHHYTDSLDFDVSCEILAETRPRRLRHGRRRGR